MRNLSLPASGPAPVPPRHAPVPPRHAPCPGRPAAGESSACSTRRGRGGTAALLGPDRSGPRSSLLARPRTWLQLPAATLPALTRRATRAGPSTSALRDRTEAASSAAGCEADPGDEMTTSTLQVALRGPAGLRRRKEARRGLRAGSRAGGSLLGAARSSPRRRRRLRPFLCSPARS